MRLLLLSFAAGAAASVPRPDPRPQVALSDFTHQSNWVLYANASEIAPLLETHPRYASALKAVAVAYGRLSFGLWGALTGACTGQQRLGGEPCGQALHCVAGPLLKTLQRSSANLQYHAASLGRSAPQPLRQELGEVRRLAASFHGPSCAPLVAALRSASDNQCLAIFMELCSCLSAIKSHAKWSMARLHAAQVSLSVPTHFYRPEDYYGSPRTMDRPDRRLEHRGEILDMLINLYLPKDRPLRVAEVGVFQGETSFMLLQRHPRLHLFLVDPYYDGSARSCEGADCTVSLSPTYLRALSRVWEFRPRASFVMQESVEAAKWVGNATLDMVFIDGDHSYEAVVGDLSAWWPTLLPGAILAGHDY
ncbi:unnamed protein product, partial [Effrenium voratum]